MERKLGTVLPNGKFVTVVTSSEDPLPEPLQLLSRSEFDVRPHVVELVKQLFPLTVPSVDPNRKPYDASVLSRSCKGGPDLGFHDARGGTVLCEIESPFINNPADLKRSLNGVLSSASILNEEEIGPILDAYLIVGRDSARIDVRQFWDESVGIKLHCLTWDEFGASISPSKSVDEKSSYTLVLVKIIELSRQLLNSVARSPEVLDGVDDRRFEEMVATLLLDLGFNDVELTLPRKDGGKDVIACYDDQETGYKEIYLFECKHWVSGKRIHAHWAISLLDVVARERATGGVLLTTSTFGRKLLEQEISFEFKKVFLRDRTHFLKWVEIWERQYGQVLMQSLDPLVALGLKDRELRCGTGEDARAG